jgi:monoamine oxidase
MSSARTPLLRSLQKAMRLSMLSEQAGMPPSDEIVDWAEDRRQAYSRRQFLRDSGLALGAVTLMPKFMFRFAPDTRIAIVGAGMAGLNAGSILKAAGLSKNFTVYEGSKRTGGRMFTRKLNNNDMTTELGGEFTDSDHTDILSMANRFGVEILDRRSDTLPVIDTFFMEGRNHTLQEAVKAFGKVRRKIGRDKKSVGKNYDKPGATRLDNMTMKEYIDSLQTDSWFKKVLEVAYIGEFGLDLDQQAALNFVDMVGRQKRGFEMFGSSDERYKLKGGNEQLCNYLAKDIEGKIELGHRLVAVKSKGDGFVLTFDTEGGPKQVEADYVLMTIPYTILRGVDGIDKLKGITPEKLQCIRELGYGMNGKYFLDLKERVWRRQGQQGYLFTENIHSGWDSYHLQGNNQGKSIFTVFLGGKAGVEMTKGGAEKFLPEIDKAFPGVKAAYTGFNEKMQWSEYEWSKGSYACYKPGQWMSISGQEAAPVGNMLFAGEHCSEDFQGYMNGAAETGRQAAEKLMAALKVGVPQRG